MGDEQTDLDVTDEITDVEGEEKHEETPASGEAQPEDHKSGIQKRIDQLTREKYDAMREAAYYKGLSESGGEPKSRETSKAAKKLDPADFDSDAEYTQAVVEQAKADMRAEFLKEQREREKASRAQTLQKQYADARKKYADFDDVALATHVPITQTMFDAAQGDNLPDVLYSLGNNLEEANRIANLPANQQIKEIGKIEARLSSAPTKSHSKTPNPPKKVGSSSATTSKSDAEKTRAELRKQWEANRIKRLKGEM